MGESTKRKVHEERSVQQEMVEGRRGNALDRNRVLTLDSQLRSEHNRIMSPAESDLAA